jgi:hypothetical protein
MNNDDFYRECARLLGCPYDCKPFPYKHSGRTRWNNRAAGSGRFEGHGIIRVFGDTVHVALTNPPLRMTGSKEEVLAILSK